MVVYRGLHAFLLKSMNGNPHVKTVSLRPFMEHLLLLVSCLLIGLVLKRIPPFSDWGANILNQFVIFVSLPALALYYIPKLELGWKLLLPLGVAWIGFGLAFTFFNVLGRIYKWPKKLTGCLILLGGLGNTSFVGFPIIEALYGSQGLKTAVIVDQPGTFLVMATLGVATASAYSRQKSSAADIVKRVFKFPPFIAFGIGLLLLLANVDFPESAQYLWKRLADTVTPLALIAVGLRLQFDAKSKHWRFFTLGLAFKLLLMPVFFASLYFGILDQTDLTAQVCVLESAMAPMITGAILATNHGLKPRLASMMIGFGIPLSLLTVGLWYMAIAFVLG